MSNKVLAVRYSIAHHLHLNDEDKEKASIFVHRHHFSTLGWSNSKEKTTPIAANTAKQSVESAVPATETTRATATKCSRT
jgi:hypothetical protein